MMLLNEAYKFFAKTIAEWQCSRRPPQNMDYSIACLSVPVASVNTLDWLIAQPSQPKLFWAQRGGAESFAGLGEAWQVSKQGPDAHRRALEQIHALLEDAAPEVRFWGGCRFDALSATSREWQSWPAACFRLPRIALCETNAAWQLLAFIPRFFKADEVAALTALHADLLDLVADIPPAMSSAPISYRQRNDVVEKQNWRTGVAESLNTIDKQYLRKVVLARAVDFSLADNTSPLQLLRVLRSTVPYAFHFCFQNNETSGFVGATPELLYRRRDSTITTEALAGTIGRGKTAEEDAALAKALQSNDKEQREHIAVLHYVEIQLRKMPLLYQGIIVYT